MRYAQLSFVLASILISACTPAAVTEPSDNSAPMTPPVSTTMTCGELLPLIRSHDRSAGAAILWLDGYYSGRAGLPGMSAGWLRTISQGVGGTCAINVNASRPVLDVIAQLHREYGGVIPKNP